MKKGFGMLVFLFAGLLLAPFVVATADGALVTNTGGTSSGNASVGTDAGGTFAIGAGGVYHLDLSANSYSNYWAGVWGNVSGAIQVEDTSGKVFMTKSITSGVPKSPGSTSGIMTLVFAYNAADTVPRFGGINAALRTGSSIDSVTGVDSTLTDSASNVFTSTSYAALLIGNQTLNGAVGNAMWCGRSYNATSGALNTSNCGIGTVGGFGTVVLNDGTSNLLFATQALQSAGQPGGLRIFDNLTNANYQMLLFVNNSGTANSQSYEFFLELR